jgi:Ca-activated chloride channel homolog
VLLTDGEHNVTSPQSRYTPRQTAQLAVSLGVPIYAIDAGNDTPSEADAPSRAASVETMRDLASITGGKYFSARDSTALVAAMREIDRLERTKITSFQYRRYHDGYPWFALAAFVCFVAAVVLERTLWRRLP